MYFKKTLRPLCLLAMFLTTLALKGTNSIAFHLNIILPATITESATLTFFYKGVCYTADADKFAAPPKKAIVEFYEKVYANEFYFLVAQDIKRPENPEIESLKTSPQHSYRLWHITAHRLDHTDDVESQTTNSSNDGMLLEWRVEEMDNKEPVIMLPDTTILFLWDPADIELRSVISDTLRPFRLLPTMLFDSKMTPESFRQKLDHMADISMDLKPFHKKIDQVRRVNVDSRTVVCLPAPPNRYILS